jgi:hypothetical protein
MCPESATGALPLRAANMTLLISSVIMARMVANTCRRQQQQQQQGIAVNMS